ncbi:MAG: GntR family transcriptional regulator [Phycicoccus sp.]
MDQTRSSGRGRYTRPYQDIAATMRARINDGRQGWRPGERLPPIAVLQVEHGHAKNTIRGALDLLHSDGLIERRGRSLYVRDQGPA